MVGDVVQVLPALEPPSALVGPFQGLVLGVVDHCLVGEIPVDACEVLDEGVGEDHVCIGAALGPALAETHAAVREPAFVAIGVEETADDAGLSVGVDDGEKGVLGPEGVPDAEDISYVASQRDAVGRYYQ